MPTEAISALPTATSVSGTDIVVLNQSGTTKTAALSLVAALSSGSSTLAADTDVALASPADGQVLEYHAASSKWINATPAGGGVSTLAALTDVNSVGVTAGEYLGFSSSPPATRRQASLFADISGSTITATLPSPALAGSLLVAYAALDNNLPTLTGFTLLTSLQPGAGLGNSVFTMRAVGGETSFTFSGISNAYGGCSAIVEEWVNAASISVYTTTSAAPTSPTTLSGIAAGNIVVMSRNVYDASAGGGALTGWTNYSHFASGNAGGLDIYEQVATGTSDSITIPAQTGGDPHYSGYIMFAIASTAPSSFVFQAPLPIATIGTTYPTSPSVGQLAYRSDLTSLAIWTGSAWVVV